jgi:cytochrome c oxidase subunit 2
MPGIHDTIGAAALLQADIIPTGTRVDVFQSIYGVFLLLGTIVGIVVVSYMLYNAYKYRAGAGKGDGAARPELGELPRGSGGGRKLFLSFGLSAVIVISLIAWTYGTLLYVEQGATSADNFEGNAEDPIEVKVIGYQFFWEFEYTNVPGHEDGLTTRGELRVPEDRMVRLNVTSGDVWHNFGIPDLRVKSDAIPGQYTTSWFEGSETGNYTARCYELCGSQHSQMQADVVVTSQENFDGWYADQMAEETDDAPPENASDGGNTTEASG